MCNIYVPLIIRSYSENYLGRGGGGEAKLIDDNFHCPIFMSNDLILQLYH